MDKTDKEAFFLAIAVHMLGFAIMLLFMLISWLRPFEEPPVVFELVDTLMADTPMPSPQMDPAPQPEPEPVPDDSQPIELPSLDPLRPVPVLPAPTPEPTPQPTPRPTPVPTPTPQQVSFEEWARNRNLPARTQPAPTPRPQRVDVPRIETDIRQSLRASVGSVEAVDTSQMTAAQRDALATYFSTLVARLQAVFDPMGAGYSARVEFTVQADGSITNVRFLRRSGDTAFDNSVMEAFRRARSPGRPPGNPPHTRTLTFTSENN